MIHHSLYIQNDKDEDVLFQCDTDEVLGVEIPRKGERIQVCGLWYKVVEVNKYFRCNTTSSTTISITVWVEEIK